MSFSTLRSQIPFLKNRRTEGFTITEIIVVLVVIGILMGILLRGLRTVQENAKQRAVRVDLQKIQLKMEDYRTSIGKYPDKMSDLAIRPTDVTSGQRWQGPYVEEKELTDPWGNAYVYKATPSGKQKYQLYSWGTNGEGSPENEWISVWNL